MWFKISKRNYVVVKNNFDDNFYKQQLGLEPISDNAKHYLTKGWKLGLDPAPWFSTEGYLALYADIAKAGINPFVHYLLHGKSEARAVPRSRREPVNLKSQDAWLMEAAIDSEFYKAQLPDVDFTIITPAMHYATAGWKAGLDPSRHFSTLGYLAQNHDVASAGVNPLLHYLQTGRDEGRQFTVVGLRNSSPETNFWEGYEAVKARSLGESRPITRSAVDFCNILTGTNLLESLELVNVALKQNSEISETIDVSVIIPCINQELVTAECLLSVANSLPSALRIEIIVADNASTDALYKKLPNYPQIRVIKFESNIGFGPACNAAADLARGKYLFFLNNDAQIAGGCLESLVEAFNTPKLAIPVGIAGPKIVSFDGTLQEAGCLLRQDGTGALIGFGMDPQTPRFTYNRSVEHVSGAALMIERDTFLGVGGFDPIYAPAYCEDADLSLKVRQKNLDILYVAKALVAHHLSKTSKDLDTSAASEKKRRIAKNRRTLVKRWVSELSNNDLKTIAFYLPQFHPIPENDEWWGKGFTEWRNVAKAIPNYVGQNQPRYPSDLGYYDLRIPEVMEEQAALARKYGISGFCYYYYWFNGHRLLESPLERLIETGKPDLPFCLCWANENWTRRWDGMADDVLMGQSYSDDDSIAIIADLIRHFRLKNYIRINGRPLILIYRLKDLPDPRRAITVWRNYCRQHGIGEICVAMVESFELSASPEDPAVYGCDITVEFPPHGMVSDPAIPVKRLNKDWTGSVHDYKELAANYMRREEAGFKRLRSVLVGWDNSPRHQNKSLILEHATPGAFQAWLEWTYQRTLEQNLGDERIVFINAWNEWCEGSYLEPDQRFGHAYLQAVNNALNNVALGGNGFAQL